MSVHLKAERGILFSRAMVAALLAGTKTQTRRAVRPQPAPGTPLRDEALPRNPFGQPGDRLWVRERYAAFGHWQTRHNPRKDREEWFFTDLTRASGQDWRYEADAPGAIAPVARSATAAPAWHARNALFMPRAASRILLQIVDVRVERLRGISPADALAEGVRRGADFAAGDPAAGDPAAGDPAAGDPAAGDPAAGDPVEAYRAVWEGINGAGNWEADPLVWVVGFRRLLP